MSSKQSIPRGRVNRWLRLRLIFVGMISLAAMARMVVIAITKVRDGRGADTYHTFWLVQDDWFGFLIFIAFTFFAVMLGLVFRWIYHRREAKMWRQIKKMDTKVR